MIILFDTSTPICKISLTDGNNRTDKQWSSDRTLAKNLLSYLKDIIDEDNKTWNDIDAIGVFEGPGSFTGLRIGLTVANTIADAQNIPIVGGRGDNWQDVVVDKINKNINEKIVLPFYGSEAKITTPRK